MDIWHPVSAVLSNLTPSPTLTSSLDDEYEQLAAYLKQKTHKEEVVIDDGDVLKMRDYRRQIARCKQCKAAEQCDTQPRGYVYIPQIRAWEEAAYLEWTLAECKYHRASRERKHRESLYKRARLSPLHLNTPYEARPYTERILERLERGAWAYIAGSVGQGKTMALTEYAKRHISEGVIYVTFGELCDAIHDKEREIIDPVYDCAITIMDDIGSGYESDYARGAIEGIIDSRYRRSKQTIMAANVRLEEWAGARTARRIKEMSKI